MTVISRLKEKYEITKFKNENKKIHFRYCAEVLHIHDVTCFGKLQHTITRKLYKA